MLVAVTGLGGLIQAVDFPARLAFVLDLTSREDLMNAVAKVETAVMDGALDGINKINGIRGTR